MQGTPGRKYQVVEEAEIELVLQCGDSHEFYERYLKVFPDTKKGLETISKIWKRRSEFAKKRQLTLPNAVTGKTSAEEIAASIAEQTKIMGEILALNKETLETNTQILAAISHQNDILTGHSEHTQREAQKETAPQTPALKHSMHVKAPEELTPVMVAS